MDICKTNYQVCDGRTRHTYKSSTFRCLMLLVVSLGFPLTLAAEMDFNADLEIRLTSHQEFLSKESLIQQYWKSINNKQGLVAELFDQLDAAIIFDEQYRVQNLFDELTVQLGQLQKHLSDQDINLEHYRYFIYRLLSNSVRKKPHTAKQQMNSEWQSLARSIFEEMSPEDKVITASRLKAILDARKGLNNLKGNSSKLPRSPYRNVARLIERHDIAFLDRAYIQIKKTYYQQLEEMVYGVIDLYRNKKFEPEKFSHDDYRELQRGVNNILLDFPEGILIENLYSTFENEVAQ